MPALAAVEFEGKRALELAGVLAEYSEVSARMPVLMRLVWMYTAQKQSGKSALAILETDAVSKAFCLQRQPLDVFLDAEVRPCHSASF
jgi:hypothetical protein